MGAWPTTNAPIAVAQAQTMPRDPSAVKESVRDRILAAAMAVAKESGAGRLSLDAIARRAGVSKGGLLYHFPKKDALMRALVEHHLAGIDEATREAENHPRQPNAVARAFIVAYRDMAGCQPTRPSGVLAALAIDLDMSLIAFLAVEGLKALDLFEADPLTTEERNRVLDGLVDRLDGG
jgi:AcrR family transcriptional regulator